MLKILIFIAIIGIVATLPVTKNKEKEKENSSTPATPDVAIALEYERYLKEIVEALESDPEFRKKLDKAPEADIRSGKIAQELDYVNHHVRSKLDEIKRREVDRLRSLATKEYELENDINREHLKIPQHLDHTNEHTFEIEDLKKLIKKTSEDLEEQDKKRREEFKEYEMQKEFERQSKLKEMDEKHRETYEHEIKEQEEKHKKHEKVHHPGNKAHLEEVWEKQDHMSKDDFDPRSFFMMHDVDSNGFWDENEVKALFVKQLDKVYQEGLPEDDMRERAEEMERMREHVFKETDVNHDNLISFQEFLEYTKREEFAEDPEWETVDQQPQYTHEEYLEFERRRQEEVKRMIDQGLLPPHPNMPQGYYTNNEHAAYQQQFQGQPGAYQQPHGGQPNYQQQQFQGQPGAYQQQPHGQQQVNQQHYQNQQQYQPQQQQIYQHQNGQPVQLHPNDVYNHIPQQQAAPQQQQAQQAAPQQQQAQQAVPQNQQFPQQQQQHQAVPQQPQQFQQQNQQQQIVVPNQQQQPVVPNQQQQPAASQNQPQAAAPNQQQHK